MWPHIFKDFIIIAAIVAVGVGFLVSNTLHHGHLSQLSAVVPEAISLLPDGTLIQVQGEEQVYYIEKGKKRWIETKEAFRIQGFKSEDIQTIPVIEVNQYPDGETITAQSYIILPQEVNNLPDLAPLPIKALQLKKLKGRTILKFTASFWNQGKRHFELAKGSKAETQNKETYQEVFQPIFQENGLYRNKVVGSFFWHAPHEHYHYSDFADYVLSFIKPLPGATAPTSPKTVRQKTTFCIRDNELFSTNLPGAPKKAVFPTCGQDHQGLSIGWIDIYKNTLPDQYIDVHDFPPGIYSLSFLLDPNYRFAEERKDNNISTIFISLDSKKNTAQIIAAAAPFTTSLNVFPDGTVVRAGGEGRSYAIHNNKKRPINSQEIFNSYGYSWDNVLILTQSMIDAIPPNNLVRLEGDNKVYALNNLGYKRHILNQDAFYSYGFTAADIADINQTEFASYPKSNLIRLAGNNEIYLIEDANKIKIGAIEDAQILGYNLDAIHTVNEIDFGSYITQTQQ